MIKRNVSILVAMVITIAAASCADVVAPVEEATTNIAVPASASVPAHCKGLACLIPDDATGWWTAIGALATATVALLAIRISVLQLFLEATPIIILSRQNGITFIENVGRGVALTISACGHDGDIKDQHESLRAGEKRPIRLTPTISVSNSVYYQGSTGQWFRSKVTGRSIIGEGKQYPVDTEFNKISHRKLPKSVRLRMRRHARSAYEHLEQVSSFVTVEGWTNRARVAINQGRRTLEMAYYSIGERRNAKEYSGYSFQGDHSKHYPLEERKTWEYDLQGIANCWHTSALDVEHFGCFTLPNGTLICEVSVEYLSEGRVQGLVAVTPKSRSSMLGLPQSARSDIVWEKLSNYLCARMPKQRFVVEV